MENDTFSTKDLQLGAYCMAKGLKFLGHHREDKRVYFSFEGKQAGEKLAQEFFGDGVVEISKYRLAMSRLRTLIFDIE